MKTVLHCKSFQLAVPFDEAFYLFTPEGEKLWAPDWEYESVLESTELSEDYVFKTKKHDHHSTEAIWLVKTYDPVAGTIEYYKVQPKDKVGVISIVCREITPTSTEVRVAYQYTALSKTGEEFIAHFDTVAYDTFIDHWEVLLGEYVSGKSENLENTSMID
jgi:hypothetical protein